MKRTLELVLNLTFIYSLFFLCGCTYSINMVHTQGKADDVIDETSSATPNTNMNISIPSI